MYTVDRQTRTKIMVSSGGKTPTTQRYCGEHFTCLEVLVTVNMLNS
jgi:hypothetical protein